MSDIIQGLWVGGSLDTMGKLSIKSFQAHGHEYHLYTYGEVDGIPAGTVIKDANEMVPESDIVRFKELANFSDWFRHRLVFTKGNWWSDLDNICLKPFDFGEPHVGACNPFKAPVGSHVLEWVIAESEKVDWQKMQWLDIGPKLWDAADLHFPDLKLKSKMGLFHPLPCREGKELEPIVGRTPPELPHAYSVHLHHNLWKCRQMDFDGVYPPTSLYETLKRRYLGAK